jgi:flagellar biosynthesis protein FlhF
MPEALDRVRADLGEDAIILHSKSTAGKGLKGMLSASRVEVIAAVDVIPPGESAVPSARPLAPFPAPKVEKDFEDSLHRLEKRIEELASKLGKPKQPSAKVPSAWAGYCDLLAGKGVSATTAREIILAAARSVEGVARPDRTAAIRRTLEERFRTSGPLEPRGDIPAVAAFIGPTGVGKTTTLAKIAATHFQRGERVALVTADTYRLAAVDQLRRYADIMEIPLEVVRDTRELPDALRKHRGADLILIDTAGRSQNHRQQMSELARLLQPIRGAEIYLVLAATASALTLRHQLDRFSPAAPTKIILSKIDELPAGGAILEATAACPLPIAYVTDGQEVPDDYWPADPARLASLALSGDPAAKGACHARMV